MSRRALALSFPGITDASACRLIQPILILSCDRPLVPAIRVHSHSLARRVRREPQVLSAQTLNGEISS